MREALSLAAGLSVDVATARLDLMKVIDNYDAEMQKSCLCG